VQPNVGTACTTSTVMSYDTPEQLRNTDIVSEEFTEGLGSEGSFNSILCPECRSKYQNFGKKKPSIWRINCTKLSRSDINGKRSLVFGE